jgi:protein subunit release factor B
VNKVASAVRITHKPTGITVTCSVERSQQQNKALALSILKSKLEALERAKRDAEVREAVGDMKGITFGSQIRNYVLDDRRVKMSATGWRTTDVESVPGSRRVGRVRRRRAARRKQTKKVNRQPVQGAGREERSFKADGPQGENTGPFRRWADIQPTPWLTLGNCTFLPWRLAWYAPG